MTESPASVSAATVQMPVASRAASAAEESPVKPTLVGTTSAIARPKGRRELVLAGLALAAVGAAGTVATMLVRARPRSVTVAAPLQLVGSSARSSSFEPSETSIPLFFSSTLRTLPSTSGMGSVGPSTCAG